MKKETGQPGHGPEEAGRVISVMENAELSRRISDLEKSVADLEKSQTERHLAQITRIFQVTGGLISLCAILVALFGWFARSDSREAARDARAEVKDAVGEMQKKFETLAGETLKKPALQLLCDVGPLENKVIAISVPQGVSPPVGELSTLFVTNSGAKKTEPLSIRISLAAPVTPTPFDRQEWELVPSTDKDFAACFYSTRHATVASGETLNIQPLLLNWEKATPYSSRETNVLCQIQVFYGGEMPAQAKFQIRAQWK